MFRHADFAVKFEIWFVEINASCGMSNASPIHEAVLCNADVSVGILSRGISDYANSMVTVEYSFWVYAQI